MKPEWCPDNVWNDAMACWKAMGFVNDRLNQLPVLARALLTARNQGRDEDSAWPADTEYAYGQPVEKFTGEAQWDGVIVSAYHTTAGKLRYVVEVKPQGFQMIAVPSQLRAKIGEHGNG